MNTEIFAALRQLEKERGIPVDYMVERITQALVAAYKKDKDGYTDNVFVELNEDHLTMFAQKEVVDDVISPATEITLDAARRIDSKAQLGDLVNVEIQTKAFGRIAAQTAKQVIIQGIREAERGMVFDSFSSKEHEILTGTVLRIDNSGDMTVRIGQGSDRTDALLAVGEQVRTEHFTEGRPDPRLCRGGAPQQPRPVVLVSRTHPALVKRLFEREVPEIESGAVEIRSISREPGSRTKLAVCATEAEHRPGRRVCRLPRRACQRHRRGAAGRKDRHRRLVGRHRPVRRLRAVPGGRDLRHAAARPEGMPRDRSGRSALACHR